jgi:anaerobic magnesium-protoporphyrin IX monomethyl ester cyclase
MKIALVNPRWDYEGSIYFGCREPHLPLEYGYARALLQAAGHEVELIDADFDELSDGTLRAQVERLAPDMTVVTTAPTYLFWRCPPPELRVPRRALEVLRGTGGVKVVVGPHASTSPETTLRKLGADVAVRGECEEVLAALAETPRAQWSELPAVVLPGPARPSRPHTTDLGRLAPLRWSAETLARKQHHHHRFDTDALQGPGAEIEWSRGCPFRCTFCAKETHRDRYRKRPLPAVLDELDGLIAAGVTYVYFIDEIFLPDQALLQALTERPVKFGVQTRIDLWSLAELDQLGAAGCVTIEAGVESVTREGRDFLDKRCKLDNDALGERLVRARQTVPFVQATLMRTHGDQSEDELARTASFRAELIAAGVWVNDPVPLFPYPGSPDYRRLWGEPDELAWERAHAHYLGHFEHLSDIQGGGDMRKLIRLPVLEGAEA